MKTAKQVSPTIPGATINMGGRDWIVPPLTLGQLRRHMSKVRSLKTVGTNMGDAEIGVLVEIVTTALSRNYPDITAAAVEDLLDMGNANAVLMTVLTGSGLTQGEAIAVANPTGEKSMASSPPPADTATP